MNRALFFILPFILFAIVPAAYGQDFPMLHYSVEDGLPSNTVYQVYKDSKNFLWIGTDKGIARYNGIKFQVFTTINGLPDNEVSFFREDAYGRVWLGTANGALCYYKDDTFHTAANTAWLKTPYKAARLQLVTPQADSSLMLVYSNPSLFVNMHNGRYDVVNISSLVNNEQYGQLLYRKKITANRYRLTFTNTELIIDTNAAIRQQFSVDTFDAAVAGKGFTSGQDQDYIFSHQSVYTPERRYAGHLPPITDNYLLRQVVNLNTNFFVATDMGLYINDTIHVLKNNDVSGVSLDYHGNYWVSTLNNGIFLLRKDYNNTSLLKNMYLGRMKYTHADKGWLFFVPDNNNLYGVNKGKLYCLNSAVNPGHKGYAVSADAGNIIDSSLGYYGFFSRSYVYKQDVFSMASHTGYSEYFDGIKEALFIGDAIYLRRSYDIIGFNKIKDNNSKPTPDVTLVTAKNEAPLSIAKDENNNLWFSAASGMYVQKEGKAVAPPQYKDLSFKDFEFLGSHLVGYTNDNQLLVCSNINSKLDIDTVTDRNCIWDGFYKLDAYHMLISTNNYYRLLTIDELSNSRNFRVSIIQDPFIPIQAEAVCTDNKNCYFFKNGQVTSVPIAGLLVPSDPPKVYFTGLRAGDKSCIIRDEVIIPFAEAKNLTISFATISFYGHDVTYQYSVSKNDKDNWLDLKGEDIGLINSGYGTFTIRVRAKTISSNYSVPVQFRLVVLRPFWATWWFVSFFVCILLAVIIVVSRQRILYVLYKRDKEHELEVRFLKSEYKALNALMNPHFIFNTLNNVQGLINKDDKLAANEYLRIIADLIRQNMHNTSKELIPLQKEIDLITNYLLLEKLRFKDKLNYSIIIEKDLDLTDIMVPPLLIQPLIENSIKHGILPLQSSDGAIYVNIYERKGVLTIEVRDNGVGINHAKTKEKTSHESFGLENIRKRIEQLSIIQNRNITFSFSERKNIRSASQWTIATITIPTW